jgi:hypothetical protein
MIECKKVKITYRYIDDVLSINNSRFAEFLPLIYPPELEVKETTDTASCSMHSNSGHSLTTFTILVNSDDKDCN